MAITGEIKEELKDIKTELKELFKEFKDDVKEDIKDLKTGQDKTNADVVEIKVCLAAIKAKQGQTFWTTKKIVAVCSAATALLGAVGYLNISVEHKPVEKPVEKPAIAATQE